MTPPPDLLDHDRADCPFPRGTDARRKWIEELRDRQTAELYEAKGGESLKGASGEVER